MSIQHLKPETALLYPEEYIIEEDLKEMGETNPHKRLMIYLRMLLEWYYHQLGWLVITEMNVYHPAIRNTRKYIVPDVALVKIALPTEEVESLTSWDAERMAPQVIVEIASDKTWPNDVGSKDSDKPAIYGRIGVKEYFTYDPNHPQVWTKSKGVRLRGWRYNEEGQPTELKPDEKGRLWSDELQSFLVPQGYLLRLTDQAGNWRLTKAEADEQARQAAEQRADSEAQARQAAEQRAAEAERQRAEMQRLLERFRQQEGQN